MRAMNMMRRVTENKYDVLRRLSLRSELADARLRAYQLITCEFENVRLC